MKKRAANILTTIVFIVCFGVLVTGVITSYYLIGVGVKEYEIEKSTIKFYNEDYIHTNSKLSFLNSLSNLPNEVLVGDVLSHNLNNISPVSLGYNELYLEEILAYEELSRNLVQKLEKYPNVRIYCPELNREIMIYKESFGSMIHRIVF